MASMHIKYDYLFKILLIGDADVGKTGIVLRFTRGTHGTKLTYIENIGIDFQIRTIQLNGKTIKLQIWDTAGAERFRSVSPNYFRGSQGVILVYDASNQKSFDNLKHWLQSIDQCASEKVKTLLLGNQNDLTKEKVVDYATAKEFADQHGISFFETNAEDFTNVEKAFMTLAAQIKDKMPPAPSPAGRGLNIKVGANAPAKQGRGGRC